MHENERRRLLRHELELRDPRQDDHPQEILGRSRNAESPDRTARYRRPRRRPPPQHGRQRQPPHPEHPRLRAHPPPPRSPAPALGRTPVDPRPPPPGPPPPHTPR